MTAGIAEIAAGKYYDFGVEMGKSMKDTIE